MMDVRVKALTAILGSVWVAAVVPEPRAPTQSQLVVNEFRIDLERSS